MFGLSQTLRSTLSAIFAGSVSVASDAGRSGLTPEEVALIQPILAYARGDESFRDEAVARHRELLASHPHLRRHPAQVFMGEVDTPCPDLGLRAEARLDLVGRHPRNRRHTT